MSVKATNNKENYTFSQLISSTYKGKDVSLGISLKDKCKIVANIVAGVALLPLFGVGGLFLKSAYTSLSLLHELKVGRLSEEDAKIDAENLNKAEQIKELRQKLKQENSEMEKEALHYIEAFNQLKNDEDLRRRGLID